MKKFMNIIYIFGKAQLSAFLGGVVDYIVMIIFTEFVGLHYTYSIAIGGVIGAIVNFSLNREWTFRSRGRAYRSSLIRQLTKFAIVVANSILMKAAGTHFFTTYFGIDYKVSRLLTDLLVSLLFNFTLQKFWVFRKQKVAVRKDSSSMK